MDIKFSIYKCDDCFTIMLTTQVTKSYIWEEYLHESSNIKKCDFRWVSDCDVIFPIDCLTFSSKDEAETALNKIQKYYNMKFACE